MLPSDYRRSRHAIELQAVTKLYGETYALNSLDINVPLGGCFGLLGPNGAGKSTVVSICATLLLPDSGMVTVMGRDALREFSLLRHDIGIVFQEPSLDQELTAREHLQFQSRLYHLGDRDRIVALALDRAGLGSIADRSVSGYSGGMKRRLEIARGLMHQPKLLFLDEPTAGLDVAGRTSIWDQIRDLVAKETTVLLTTHSMEEADALCSEIAIIDRGRIVAQGSPTELKTDLGGDVIRIIVRDGDGIQQRLSDLPLLHATLFEVEKNIESTVVRFVTKDGSHRLPGILDAVRSHGIQEVTLERPTLEHVFLHHTGRSFDQDDESLVL